MEALSADDDFLPTFYSTPRIAGVFSDWHYRDMREIVPFCKDNDPSPPDFADMLFVEKAVKFRLDLDELTKEQKILVEERQLRFYQDNWS